MPEQPESEPTVTNRAQQLFKEAPDALRELVRTVLNEERQVVHLRRRGEIHQRIYEHVKRVIK